MEKYNEPQIFVVNNNEIANTLSNDYHVRTGNLGVKKYIEYGTYKYPVMVDLEYDIISNLHEYRVIIIDMQNDIAAINCDKSDEPKGKTSLYKVTYPQNCFNPVPLVLEKIKGEIGDHHLRIIFAGDCYYENYTLTKIGERGGCGDSNRGPRGVYETLGARGFAKKGERIRKDNNNPLSDLIEKYAIGYDAAFEMPSVSDGYNYKKDLNFCPLLKNCDGEVVSYYGRSKNSGYEIVLPLCKKKDELVVKLLTEVLPNYMPDIFPESNQFVWLNDEFFRPDDIKKLEQEQKLIEAEFKTKLNSLDIKRKEIEQKYSYLKDLITETGGILVKAVCTFFEWLEFSDVRAIDGSEDVLREDIQIVDGNKMFIIEVKGIGGTSTDDECAQVGKHRRKREKENRDKEIIPIYIVNHQRYTRPSARKNPPFSDNQIDYAENDERGLLTTWQLYNQYKLIERGIFTKEETREALTNKWGLISLLPKTMKKIGRYDEFFKNKNAGILNLGDVTIHVGDTVYAQKGEEWKKTIIKSLQIDGKDVSSADHGEVGIVTEEELGKGFELYIKIHS